MMADALEFERARHMVAAMEAMGLPAIVLSLRGKVLAKNPLAAARCDLFRLRAHGGLTLPTPQADALLAEGISAIGAEEASAQSIPVQPRDDRPAAVIHLLPVRGGARDVCSGDGEVLVVANELRPGIGPSVKLLMGLYDLTRSEARIAAELTRGSTLQDAARAQSIRISTARAYLARIFSKTGTNQQSQLVALLSATGRATSAG